MPSVWWLFVGFPLVFAVDFYPVNYYPTDYGLGSRRDCPTIHDCDIDYLCNMWWEDIGDGLGTTCFLGKPKKFTPTKGKKAFLKVRSSNQCGDGDEHQNLANIVNECIDGFDCRSMVELVMQEGVSSQEQMRYEYIDPETKKTLFTFDVSKDVSEAPFTEDNYWKMFKVTLTPQDVGNCWHAIGNGNILGPNMACTVGDPMQVYCRKGKLYFNGEDMKQQLRVYRLDGKEYLSL